MTCKDKASYGSSPPCSADLTFQFTAVYSRADFSEHLPHVDVDWVQPVPWKMRLEMAKEMQIEILNGGEILVNKSKSRKSTFSVSHGTKWNWDFDWIWIPRYLAVQIQIEILV